jgi:hypothetical protein
VDPGTDADPGKRYRNSRASGALGADTQESLGADTQE